MSQDEPKRASVPHTIRRLAVPILLLWVALAAITNTAVPQLEEVGKNHNVALNSPDAPSLKAIKRIGQAFGEFDTDSTAMIVLEGDKPLGDDAHRFYDTMIHKLEQDKKYVQHVQDYWGDTLTAAGSQSSDGKAAYVQVNLVGNQGSAEANEAVGAIRDIVEHTQPPPGVKAYVTGPAPLISDQFDVGSKGTAKVTAITIGVIALMLFFVYRSVLTTLLVLATVLVEMSAARGIVAFLGNAGIIGLSTYATNILTLLVIAAGTDYAIFFVGRYQEARAAGEDRESAFYTMYRGTAHIVLGSGLTVAGATACLSFTRLPYFQSLGIPAALGVLIALFAALTLGPAVLTLGALVGIFDPKRAMRTRGWRRIGTAIVRWPGPVLAMACALALVGLLALPGYKTSFDTRPYMPASAPANVGYTAAERHFSRARLEPELMMVETDHDMRNPADMLVLDKVAKAVFHVPGVAQVQTITRPLGTPLVHSSLAFVVSNSSAAQQQNLTYQRDRADDVLKQANELSKTINILKQQYVLQQQLADATHSETQSFHDTIATINDLRDKLANFDDFLRPVRSYFYWEKHCYDIPACFALRSVFEALDATDQLSAKFEDLTATLDKLDALQPKLVALIPPQIESQETNRDLSLANYATLSGIYAQTAAAIDNATALGRAFDAAKNDDTFYLPPEVFNNPDFKRGLKLFLSPDGKAVRMIVTHEGDPATTEGISHIDPIAKAAHEALKGTPHGRCPRLSRRDRRDVQGHQGWRLLRCADRGIRRNGPHFADHDDHHAKPGCRARHRGHGGPVAGRLVRAVRAGLAVHFRHRAVLGGACAGRDPAAGRRIRLQPVADLPVQGRDPCRPEDRCRARDGRHRLGGHLRRHRLRRHHVRLYLQRFSSSRSDRHHHRPWVVVRHADRAVIHDALARNASRALVLVAAAGAPASGQHDAATLRAASGGSSAAAVGRRRPGRDVRIALCISLTGDYHPPRHPGSLRQTAPSIL